MNQQAILAGLAEALELDSVTPETVLAECEAWDSMAVVMTIALLDEHAGVQVDGKKLSECRTVADVLRLAGVAA